MKHLAVFLVIFQSFQSAAVVAQPTKEMIAGVTDHTFLKTSEHGVTLEQQRAAVAQLVDEAHQHGAFSVCVRENMVSHARQLIDKLNSPVKLAPWLAFRAAINLPRKKKSPLFVNAEKTAPTNTTWFCVTKISRRATRKKSTETSCGFRKKLAIKS